MPDLRQLILRAGQECLRPRRRLTLSEWADAYRFVPSGTTPEPGPWTTSRVPYLREPMDACASRKGPQTVVLMFSSQVGKTELMLNCVGYFADQEPSAQLMLQPTLEAAEAFSRERLEPMIRATPALSALIDQRERTRGQTMRRKDFPGGYLALVGTNSPAGLASRPIRVLLCDETDRYVETREGDPVALAMQRTANFSDRHIVLASTPGVAGSSCIENWFLRGDQREFRIPCPSCGHRFAWTWPLVRWDTRGGEPDPATARIECPSCGAAVRGAGKPHPDLLAAGAWAPTAQGDPGIRSYHLSALCSPWVELQTLVSDFLAVTSRRDKAGLREFVNLRLGEPWEEQSTAPVGWAELRDRRDAYTPTTLPAGALLCTAGVDVQRDRLEATVWAWGAGKESWAAEHRVIFGAPDAPGTWADLSTFLASARMRADGVRLPVACTLIDSGDGVTSRDVYAFARAHEAERVFACKGRGGSGIPIALPPTRRNADGVMLVNVGVDAAKSALMARLSLIEPGPGRIHFPDGDALGFSDEYFRQLTAEIVERRRRGNVVKQTWRKTRERNEALDCAVYALAALELIHPDFDALASAAQPSGPAVPQTVPRRKRRPPSRGVEL